MADSTYLYTYYLTGANTDVLVSKNDLRIGLALTNRDLASTMYISRSAQITAGSSASIRIRPNETLTLLALEGDDCRGPFYATGTAGIAVEIIESVKR